MEPARCRWRHLWRGFRESVLLCGRLVGALAARNRHKLSQTSCFTEPRVCKATATRDNVRPDPYQVKIEVIDPKGRASRARTNFSTHCELAGDCYYTTEESSSLSWTIRNWPHG